MKMKIKIKKLHPDALMPTQGTADAACFDLYAVENVTLAAKQPRRKISTGIAMEIPAGYCGRVYSRSSSFLKGLDVGSLVVDADYRGEIFVMAGYTSKSIGDEFYSIKKGDRIAQIRIEKLVLTEFEWADELSVTERGTGGYGSTGR